MEVAITYGSEKVKVTIPDKNLSGIITPKQLESKSDIEKELQRVLDNPHGPLLSELSKSKSVCVLVEDHTRDEPHWELLSAVIPQLIHANNVQFIITTGSHEVNNPGNQEIVEMIHRAADEVRLSHYDVIIHDS